MCVFSCVMCDGVRGDRDRRTRKTQLRTGSGFHSRDLVGSAEEVRANQNQMSAIRVRSAGLPVSRSRLERVL